MGLGSPVHWLLLIGVAVILLGGGRFSNLMGDVAKGIKSFKKGMAEDDEPAVPRAPTRLEGRPADAMPTSPVESRDADRSL